MMPGNYGNYDIPNPGSLPVFRKPCGCVMRLTSVGVEEQVDEITLLTIITVSNIFQNEQGEMTWTCVKEGPRGPEESEIKIPRVRLTGQGKMPVVDMRKLNSVFDEGLPPRHCQKF